MILRRVLRAQVVVLPGYGLADPTAELQRAGDISRRQDCHFTDTPSLSR